jgi:organic hydroperoxide reductase OsmC/OhrA
MSKFPMKFYVSSEACSGIQSNWFSKESGASPIECCIPVEFMGKGQGNSPEGLFASSILNCLIALYKVYMEKSRVTFDSIQTKATLTVEKDQEGVSFHVSALHFEISVVGSSDQIKAEKLLHSAIKDCPMSNSIKPSICKTFEIKIT